MDQLRARIYSSLLASIVFKRREVGEVEQEERKKKGVEKKQKCEDNFERRLVLACGGRVAVPVETRLFLHTWMQYGRLSIRSLVSSSSICINQFIYTSFYSTVGASRN